MTERRARRIALLAFLFAAGVVVTVSYAAVSRLMVRASIARADFFVRAVERRHVPLGEALPRIADGLRFPGIHAFVRTDTSGPIRYDDAPLVAHEMVTKLLADPDVLVRVGSGSIVIAPNVGPLFLVLAFLVLAAFAIELVATTLLARFAPYSDTSTAASRAHGIVADVGHELRTPLTVIMGYVDLLDSNRAGDAEMQRMLYDRVLVECRRMRSLIERVLSLSRLEGARRAAREPLDVAALTTDVVRGLEAPLATRVSVGSCDGAVVRANAGDLREALGNLVQNALSYTTGPVRVSVSERRGVVLVTVDDDGPGMSADEVARAFERFYRGADRHDGEGSGLGLAIAKAAVERNGGSISLASSSGAGTSVRLHFAKCRVPARRNAALPAILTRS